MRLGPLQKSRAWLGDSVPFSRSVMSDPLRSHGLQHARLPFPLPTLGACSNSCPLSRWCYPTISFSVIPVSSWFQTFPALGSFLMSQFFTSGGQSIGVSASASVKLSLESQTLPTHLSGWGTASPTEGAEPGWAPTPTSLRLCSHHGEGQQMPWSPAGWAPLGRGAPVCE